MIALDGRRCQISNLRDRSACRPNDRILDQIRSRRAPVIDRKSIQHTDERCPDDAADAAVFDPGRSYYIQQSYYAGAGSAVTARTYVYERSGESMAPYVTRTAEGWSIRRGAPRLGNLSDLIRLKTADPTATADGTGDGDIVDDGAPLAGDGSTQG